jgi:hypothetical protein
MLRGKLKFLVGIILLVMIVIAGYVLYLYQKGGTEHYKPPVTKTDSPKMQVLGDLTVLSQAIETYYAKNLRYPEKLEQLKPEFIDKIPLEPGTEKSFIYESDEFDRYRITVSEPHRHGFKELFIENGKIVQK